MKFKIKRNVLKVILSLSLMMMICFAVAPTFASATNNNSTTNNANAEPETDNNDSLDLNISSNAGSVNLESTLQILLLLTVLSIAPSILIMVTSFVRVVVVLHFLRTALGTQTTPPNQVIIALALFITFAIMTPVFNEVNTDAIKPYQAGTITQSQAIKAGCKPLRTFMLKQTRDKDLKLFMNINSSSSNATVSDYDDIPITTIIPAFMISELRTAFIIGFIIYLPFIVIDMVVASTLMSMGMMMLPPTTISLPFKLLLFVLADGWNLVVAQLVQSFK